MGWPRRSSFPTPRSKLPLCGPYRSITLPRRYLLLTPSLSPTRLNALHVSSYCHEFVAGTTSFSVGRTSFVFKRLPTSATMSSTLPPLESISRENHGPAVVATAYVLIVVTLLFTTIRLATTIFLKRGFGYDDAFLVFAVVRTSTPASRSEAKWMTELVTDFCLGRDDCVGPSGGFWIGEVRTQT